MSDPGKAVFLSYASQDADAAKRICEALRAAGVEVWFDQSELRGGDAWDAKIRKQIKECALFVPVVSANTNVRAEGYFRREWKLAIERTHDLADDVPFLFPVVLGDVTDATARVPDKFREVQWTRLKVEETPAGLAGRVARLLGGDGAGGGDPGSASAKTGAGSPAPAPRRSRRSRWQWWMILPVAGTLVGLGFAVLPLWRAMQGPPAGPAVAAPAAAPVSEARGLVARAWTQMNRADLDRAQLETVDGLGRRATESDPNDAAAWAAWSQADSWMVYHNFDASPARREAARTKAARAMQLAPDSSEARLAQACYLVRGQAGGDATLPMYSGEAEQLLRTLLREKPDEPRALLALGILLRNTGAFPESRGTFRRLAGNPAFAAQGWNELGWAEFVAGDLPAAEAAIDRSIALQPYWGNLSLKSILAQWWWGDLDQARALMDRMPLASRQESIGLYRILELHYYRREPEVMLQVLKGVSRDWIQSNGFEGPVAYFAGLAHQMAGRTAAAQVQWQAALKQVESRLAENPDSALLMDWKGRLLAASGRLGEAEPVLRLASEMGGVAPSLLGTRMSDHILLGRWDEAIAQLEQSADAQAPRFTAALLRLSPRHDPLRSHPRFQALLARMEADPRFSPKAKSPSTPSPNSDPPSPSSPPPVESKSVAVLAFANLSDDKGNEYFSDGISEELLNVLAKVPGLKVSARTSAFHFKGKDTPISEIARQLGVAYVVEGSVRKQGDKVRIAAQLIKAGDGFHLWSDTFTRDLKDIFAVQDEIAGLIAQQLQLKLGGSDRPPRTVNPEAHRLALEGRHFWILRTDAAIARAEAAYVQARRIDPDFAEAHLGLANVRMVRGWYASLQGTMAAPDFVLARESAEQALRLDPTLSEAYAVLGGVAYNQWRFTEAEQAFQTALRMNPNYSFAHHWRAHLLMARGRLDESLVELERAVQLDPLQFVTLVIYALHLQYAGRHAEALAVCERAQALTPNFFVPLQAARATSLHQLGRTDEARAEVRRVTGDLSVKPRWWADGEMVRLLREHGEEQAAADLAAQVLAAAREESSAQQTALAALGRTEEALVSLERTRPGASGLGPVFYTPAWAAVRRHPRFAEVLARLGILEEYRTAQATQARMLKEQEARQ